MQHHVVLAWLHALHGFVVADDAALLAQVIGQCFRDFAVEK